MPKGSEYRGPAEALERYLAVVAHSDSGVEVKGAKNPYTSRNGHMFSFLDPEGLMALRLSDVDGDRFREEYGGGPVVQYGSVMRGYVPVPAELLERTGDLSVWFDLSHDWIGTLPPKATKK